MGRGNCCVTGDFEGLYYIDNEDFHVYYNDSGEIPEERFMRDLSYGELISGDWLYDETATRDEYESIIDYFTEAFVRKFPSFYTANSNWYDGCCPIVENRLFIVVTEDNDWSVAVKLLQKENPYDNQLSGLQKKHYKRYLDGIKDCLLSQLPKIGAYSGPWTHSVIRAEAP